MRSSVVMLVIDGDASTELARYAEILKDRPTDRIWYVEGATAMDQIVGNPDQWSAVEAVVIASQKNPEIKVSAFMDRNRTIYDATQTGGTWRVVRRFMLSPQTAAISLQAA